MNIEVALNRSDRLLVEIHAYARLRGRRLSVSPRRNAAHVDIKKSDTTSRRWLDRDTREHPCVIVKVLNTQLGNFLGAQRLDANRHVLQVLSSLLSGHHHFFEALSV